MCLFFGKENLSRKPPADISLCLIGPSWFVLTPIPGKREQPTVVGFDQACLISWDWVLCYLSKIRILLAGKKGEWLLVGNQQQCLPQIAKHTNRNPVSSLFFNFTKGKLKLFTTLSRKNKVK